MNAQHKQALKQGRERAARDRRRESIRRVSEFKAWLKAGSVLRDIPEIPSDYDYEVWRQQSA